MTLLELKNLAYYYPRSRRPALWQLNLNIQPGEFLLITGRSGSGKSTLAKALVRLVPDFYGGRLAGHIKYRGIPLRNWDSRNLCRQIGMVFQDPDSQLFFGNLERDIAFGLENLGLEQSLMQRRIAEVLALLNLGELRGQPLAHLSGGQRQKVALAGTLAMNPEVLVLDEPTSQLDPVSAGEFLDFIKSLNEETGVTVILVEQRLDKCLALCDRVVVMEAGSIAFDGTPRRQVEWAASQAPELLPVIPGIFAAAGSFPLPLNVKEGRKLIAGLSLLPASSAHNNEERLPLEGDKTSAEPLIRMDRVNFFYPGAKRAIADLSMEIYRGEIVALIGANGAGKSTLLKLLMGIVQADSGKIRVAHLSGPDLRVDKMAEAVAYLPQDTRDYFIGSTLADDLAISQKDGPGSPPEGGWLERWGLTHLQKQDPRQLSVGERQKAALACALSAQPQVIFLDEPGRGMDGPTRRELGKTLQQISGQGQVTIVLATHDIELVAEYASRIVFLHEGRVIADGAADTVLAGNTFYTSLPGKLFKGLDDQVINFGQAIHRLGAIAENPERNCHEA